MPAYQYSAIDAAGKQKQGVLEGDSARQIRQQLRDQNLMVISVESVDHAKARSDKGRWFVRQMPPYELALMTRQLSVMSASSIPLEEGLRAVAKQAEKKSTQGLVLSVRSKVMEGLSLAQALEKTGAFPAIYIATVAAGEKSGHLDLILSQLADYTESRYTIKKKIQGAMIYPIILLLMAFGIVMGLMTFVVPQIVKVIQDSKQALPLLTTIMISASNFIRGYWPAIFIVLAAITFALYRLYKTEQGHYQFDRFALKAPIFGKLVRNLNAARLASTLSILVRSGVPLVEALRIGANVTGNWIMRDAVNVAMNRVTEGASLSNQLDKAALFPPMMIQMIKSGEQSGELDAMMARAAQMQENEATSYIETLLKLLEPLMLVLMAGVVLLIVLSVMLPIINMNNIMG